MFITKTVPPFRFFYFISLLFCFQMIFKIQKKVLIRMDLRSNESQLFISLLVRWIGRRNTHSWRASENYDRTRIVSNVEWFVSVFSYFSVRRVNGSSFEKMLGIIISLFMATCSVTNSEEVFRYILPIKPLAPTNLKWACKFYWYLLPFRFVTGSTTVSHLPAQQTNVETICLPFLQTRS